MKKTSCTVMIVPWALVTFLVNCATAAPDNPPRPRLPANLKAPATEQVALEVAAQGVQIYACTANKDNPTQFEWTLKAPEAALYDRAGHKIGRHYAGPTWELNDGSKVVGEVTARADAPDAQAIPWLLLKAHATAGTGKLSSVTSIQRVNTVGGQAPTGGCDQTHGGNERHVAYTATYYFYVAKP